MSEPKFNSEPVWLNADGTKSPIVKATADAALPASEPAPVPSQEFLQALVAAEEDRLRAEGWRACIEHIRRTYHEWLSPEDMYFVARQNPYAPATRPSRDGAAKGETYHQQDGSWEVHRDSARCEHRFPTHPVVVLDPAPVVARPAPQTEGERDR